VRFRIAYGLVGADIKQHYGHDLAGKFLDEIDVAAPLQFLVSPMQRHGGKPRADLLPQ
jgi:hypothetical protein